MSPFPSLDKPFGILQPFQSYLVNNATPITADNWPRALILPLLPLGLQCYLAQQPNTRLYRIGLGAVGLTLTLGTWGTYRFTAPEYNAFNAGIGLTFLHISGKYMQFAMLEEPVVDPYLERGRPRLLSALDLAMNSRLIGLGPVGVGSVGLRGQGDTPNGANGGVPVVGKEPTVGKLRRKRSRPEATLRHIGHFLVHYTTLDTLLYLMGTLGPTTIGNPRGAPNALHDFVYNNTYISLPRLYPTVVPPIIVEAVTTLGMAVGTWQGFSMGYHFFAALAVGSALWETESWELDLFDAPWKAESMLDLWGKRWHQLFRHHFMLVSSFLRIPARSGINLPLIFLLSGAYHAFGMLTMNPVPALWPLGTLFVLSGMGAAIEITFRKFTGRRVHGPAGRAWMWSWMLYTGRPALAAFLNSGVGGSWLTPRQGMEGFRPGVWVGSFITKWLFKVQSA